MRRVVFLPEVAADLTSIFDHVVRDAPTAAHRLVRDIRAFCEQLALFPERGTRRTDIRPGMRTVGFRKCATIVFAIRPDRIVIVAVLYRGRDIDAALDERLR